ELRIDGDLAELPLAGDDDTDLVARRGAGHLAVLDALLDVVDLALHAGCLPHELVHSAAELHDGAGVYAEKRPRTQPGSSMGRRIPGRSSARGVYGKTSALRHW